MRQDFYLKIEGRVLKLTNLEKVFYPSTGTTKRDIIRYYSRIGPHVLRHLRDRPFTLRRFPDGVDQPGFFEKQCPSHRPDWIATEQFDSTRYCLVNDLASLLWVVNLAAIELHTTLATIKDLRVPTMMVFDLDPGEGIGLKECAEVALLLRRELAARSLECSVKTSGKKGLHVYVPINSPSSYDLTRKCSRSIGEVLMGRHPDLVLTQMSKRLRFGKVFIDWSQNTDFKTTTTVYSLRAAEFPRVSTPVTWREIEEAARRDSAAKRLLEFEMHDVLKRVEKLGDLFEEVLTTRQRITGERKIA